jgi:hypothetical protein
MIHNKWYLNQESILTTKNIGHQPPPKTLRGVPKYQFSQGEAPFPGHKNRLFHRGWHRYYLSRTSSVSPPLAHTRTAADTGESVSHESKANKLKKESIGSARTPGAACEAVMHCTTHRLSASACYALVVPAQLKHGPVPARLRLSPAAAGSSLASAKCRRRAHCCTSMLTVYFGAPSKFITLWFGFDYGTNPPLGTLII